MNLFEYIKSQLPQMPNVAIMKQLGASDELVEYVKETTWNTNLGMLAVYGCEPGGDDGDQGEVWAVSPEGNGEISLTVDENSAEGDGTTTKRFTEWLDLVANPQNYTISMMATFPTVEKCEKSLLFDGEAWVTPQSTDAYKLEANISGDSESIFVSTEAYYYDKTSEKEEDATKTEIIVTKK